MTRNDQESLAKAGRPESGKVSKSDKSGDSGLAQTLTDVPARQLAGVLCGRPGLRGLPEPGWEAPAGRSRPELSRFLGRRRRAITRGLAKNG